MLHFDYNWDLSFAGITLDEELNVDNLGWTDGDYFKLETIDGRRYLRRVDPLVAFIVAAKEEMKNEL
jgi:hypothetical protein